MIFDMVIYVTLIHLKETECIILILFKRAVYFFVYVFYNLQLWTNQNDISQR